MSYRKLFVVGCPRSGTSWITQLIGSHPEVLVGSTESQAYPTIFDPFYRRRYQTLGRRIRKMRDVASAGGWLSVLTGVSEDQTWRNIVQSYQDNLGYIVGLHPFVDTSEFEQIVEEVKRLDTTDALEKSQAAIRGVFDRFWEKRHVNESVFAEKTPLHIRYVEHILAFFPEAKVVEVVRDGRDVDVSRSAMATNPANAWADASTQQKIDLWLECIGLGDRYLQDDMLASRVYRVRFEDMRLNPQQTLSDLYGFCELEASAEKCDEILHSLDISTIAERREGHFIRSGIVGEWEQGLSPEAIEQWNHDAGDVLERLGYARPNREGANA